MASLRSGNSLLLISLPLLLLFSSASITASAGAVFREYIGALFNGVKLSDVPIVDNNLHVHFILAFAIDYTSAGAPTDGDFKRYWDTNSIRPEAVAAIKAAHPNVKVALSLGGDTVSGHPVKFSASTADSWIGNAVRSLTAMIRMYNLDGIDVDYEHFQSDAPTFSRCIGGLISRLKADGVISFASIAPFDDATVQEYYSTLWQDHAADINFVNFQFYAYSASTTVDQFVAYYYNQKKRYSGGKVLVSFSSGGSGGLTPANGFFTACQKLKDQSELHGIFIWCADSSKAGGFQNEPKAQRILLDPPPPQASLPSRTFWVAK